MFELPVRIIRAFIFVVLSDLALERVELEGEARVTDWFHLASERKKKNANLLSSVSSIAVLPRQASCDGLSLFKDVGGLAILERNLLHG